MAVECPHLQSRLDYGLALKGRGVQDGATGTHGSIMCDATLFDDEQSKLNKRIIVASILLVAVLTSGIILIGFVQQGSEGGLTLFLAPVTSCQQSFVFSPDVVSLAIPALFSKFHSIQTLAVASLIVRNLLTVQKQTSSGPRASTSPIAYGSFHKTSHLTAERVE
jgi:hypothetical protein